MTEATLPRAHAAPQAHPARAAASRGAGITTRPLVRRFLVTLGVAGSLLLAGATVRAASLWAAAQAPLTVAPQSVESVQAALDAERSRSVDLQLQLSALQSSTSQLSSALLEAQSRMGADQASAQQLRTSLAAAQDKLTKLEASLAAAAKHATTVGGSSGGSGGGSSGGSEPYDD
jgi:septal ring factor EnvC (AmiA/AmiB activator)